MKKITGFFAGQPAGSLSKEDLLAGVADKICAPYLGNPPEKVTNKLLGIDMLNAISGHKEYVSF